MRKKKQKSKNLILRSFLVEEKLYEDIRSLSDLEGISISSCINQLLKQSLEFKRKRQKRGKKYIIKSFSLDEELIKKISLLAKKQHVSISLLVNQLIEKALKDTKEN